MNILYIGDNSQNSTSLHRALALERLGHNVYHYNIETIIYDYSKFVGKLHYYTGFYFVQNKICHLLMTIISNLPIINLVWINHGELIGIEAVAVLKKLECPVVIYNLDDPTGNRDGARFKTLKKAIPHYDLCVVVREVNVKEYYDLGAKNVLKVSRAYDEIAHHPFESQSDIPERFKSDVVFIGTWMRHEGRDRFLLNLIEQGVPVSIWGDRWTKSPNFKKLAAYYRGGSLYGRDYIAAIQGAKICIGMLSKGNRDAETQRSYEIPFIGGLFCAERTLEHQLLYSENVEAVYWSNAVECANVCKQLLNNPSEIDRIKVAGMLKAKNNKTGNMDIANKVIETILSI